MLLATAGLYVGKNVNYIALSGVHHYTPGFKRSTGDCYCLVLLQLVKFQSEPPLS